MKTTEMNKIKSICAKYKKLSTIGIKVNRILEHTKCWSTYRCVSNYAINDTIDIVNGESKVVFSHTINK